LSKNRIARQGLDLTLAPGELLRRCAGEAYPFVLDGAGGASWRGRQSFLGFAPSAVLRIDADGSTTLRCGTSVRALSGDPLALLAEFVAEHHAADAPDDAAFVVAALSYDLRFAIERLRNARPLPAKQPLLHAAAYDWLVVHDADRHAWELRLRPGADIDLHAVAECVRQRAARVEPRRTAGFGGPLRPDFSPADHERGVRRALDYIAAGDIYQVNLAQRFTAAGPIDAPGLFEALQRRHPAPFAACVDAGDFTLVSNSPECFLQRDGDRLATFPIKGTRPRAAGAEADARLRAELVADAKERAEHVMIVDLERNDLGRVCRTGSVVVPERMRVETFPSLHHLVSEVAGVLRPGVGLQEILRATFPGGSITGAPKIRAMEVIDELESGPRGFYTGAIGLLGPRWARLSIAIRTATVTSAGLVYHAGGGIVADSEPRREYEEVLLKARPLAEVLSLAPAPPRTASAA
jgi:para-aminobenzoate synthetase component 1